MPEQDRVDRFIQNFPKYLLLFTILFLITLYILIWLVDFKQVYVLGITEWTHQFPAPIFWLHIFREGFLVENLQWLFLGFSSMLAFAMVFIGRFDDKRTRTGWLLFGIGLFIMLLEDSINLRHRLNYFLSQTVNFGPDEYEEWVWSYYGISVELIFYAMLGTIMLISFYVLYKYALNKSEKKILVIGYCFYAIAAIASATRHIGSWYYTAGECLLDLFTGTNELGWNSESLLFSIHPLSYYFMDHIIEESIELLAASLILITIYSSLTKNL